MDFPKDFIWGTATSAHQIEGNNKNNDWWHWEQNPKLQKAKLKDKSELACDSYNRYEEDFDLCKQLNNNAVRISIEWSRIEPDEGKFSNIEFEHYRKVLISAKERGLKTFVTLHHFTNPMWFIKKGGWVRFNSAKKFTKYATEVAKRLDTYIDVYTTINEPHAYTAVSYLVGRWPPQKKNLFSAFCVHSNMIRAHNKSYFEMKKVTQKPIGIVKNISWFEAGEGSLKFIDNIIAKIIYFLNCDTFLKFVNKKTDYIGLNYYFANRIHNLKQISPSEVYSDLGWSIYPKGLECVLKDLKRFNKPIYITENGLADSTDRIREYFIKEMLVSCHKAIESGVNLKGYFHWSLLDNFEWAFGYWPRFGLVEVDYEDNLKRKPRKSFYYYANICSRNSL